MQLNEAAWFSISSTMRRLMSCGHIPTVPQLVRMHVGFGQGQDGSSHEDKGAAAARTTMASCVLARMVPPNSAVSAMML